MVERPSVRLLIKVDIKDLEVPHFNKLLSLMIITDHNKKTIESVRFTIKLARVIDMLITKRVGLCKAFQEISCKKVASSTLSRLMASSTQTDLETRTHFSLHLVKLISRSYNLVKSSYQHRKASRGRAQSDSLDRVVH